MTKRRGKRRISPPGGRSTGSGEDTSGAGGFLMGMRRGTQQLVGNEQAGAAKKKKRRIGVVDIVLWALVIGLLIYVLATRLG